MRKSGLHSKGFTLIELMIVCSIVGIIMMIAWPSYNESREKGRRSDGKTALIDVASKMESFFYTNKTYTDDLTAIGFPTDPYESPDGIYLINVSPSTPACPIDSCFELEAVAQGVQANDGNLTLNSMGQKLPADKW